MAINTDHSLIEEMKGTVHNAQYASVYGTIPSFSKKSPACWKTHKLRKPIHVEPIAFIYRSKA